MSLFRRNIEIDINPGTDGQLILITTLTDIYHDIRLTLQISSVTYEITEASLDMNRIPHPDCPAIEAKVTRLKGAQVGPGFTKQVLSVLGGEKGCPNLTNLVMLSAPLAMNAAAVLKQKEENLSEAEMDALWQKVLGGVCVAYPRQEGE
ncbi:DUF2889 domain-containing protein [Dethiobacter alkaliphilus]|uniref:DUF2889 domain-containing protein n=1 Tax=Dethiobacter alkaliphilus AHT 1 TaxID=555088 RepID=C0GJ42_DETAL|nr:DUF2889 domain-containing protein [Dethiobacter alkaliphilus]EEG76675.1 conserved hypothetical protein [Dethiobacter alkaliphilus AHT 1]